MPQSVIRSVKPSQIDFAPNEIDAHFWNARQSFGEIKMAELRESIQKDGLLQDPILRVRGKRYQIVVGDRRVRCIKALLSRNAKVYNPLNGQMEPARKAYNTLTCKVFLNCSDKEASTISVAENINRDDITEVDMMTYCITLHEKIDPRTKERMWTREDIQAIIGRSATWISQTMKLFELTPKAKQMLATGELPRTVALKLLNVQPDMVDKVLQLAAVEAVQDKEEEVARLGREIERLEEKADEAEFEAVTAEAGTIEHKRKAKTIKAQVDKKLAEARSRHHTAQRREPRLGADSLQTVTTKLGAQKGKASGLSHRMIRNQLAKLDEESGLGGVTHDGQKLDDRDVKLLREFYRMVLGQRSVRTGVELLAQIYGEEGRDGFKPYDEAA